MKIDVSPAADPVAPTEAEERMEAVRPDIRLCNCGGCRKLLVGRKDSRRIKHLPEAVKMLFPAEVVAGRVDDRPTCSACLNGTKPRTAHPAPFTASRT